MKNVRFENMFLSIYRCNIALVAGILMYTSTLKKILDETSDPHSIHTRKIDFKQKSSWHLDVDMLVNESIVRNFTWAQWDPIVQAIYYIHLKPSTTRSLLEKDEKDNGLSPTLSAYQFNDDLPTETVVSCCKCDAHRRNQIFSFHIFCSSTFR